MKYWILTLTLTLSSFAIGRITSRYEAGSIARQPSSDFNSQAAVDPVFESARDFYIGGKYRACLQKLSELHRAVPAYTRLEVSFESSKRLEANCLQGQELFEPQ